MAFCPYRIDGRLPGADKILLARALHNIPPEMSMEESLGASGFIRGEEIRFVHRAKGLQYRPRLMMG